MTLFLFPDFIAMDKFPIIHWMKVLVFKHLCLSPSNWRSIGACIVSLALVKGVCKCSLLSWASVLFPIYWQCLAWKGVGFLATALHVSIGMAIWFYSWVCWYGSLYKTSIFKYWTNLACLEWILLNNDTIFIFLRILFANIVLLALRFQLIRDIGL